MRSLKNFGNFRATKTKQLKITFDLTEYLTADSKFEKLVKFIEKYE